MNDCLDESGDPLSATDYHDPPCCFVLGINFSSVPAIAVAVATYSSAGHHHAFYRRSVNAWAWNVVVVDFPVESFSCAYAMGGAVTDPSFGNYFALHRDGRDVYFYLVIGVDVYFYLVISSATGIGDFRAFHGPLDHFPLVCCASSLRHA
jgi:hypothetical protein